MKSRVCIFFFLLGVSIATLEAQASQLRGEIEKIIRYEMEIDFGIVPGLLVGVVDGDSSYVCSFGQLMDKDSIYEMGGATKPVVSMLVNRLLDSLRWTDDLSICQFLPDTLCDDHWKQLTISHLINHQTGLPKFPLNIGEVEESVLDPYALYDILRLAKDIKKMIPIEGKFSYSHVNYALFHWLFERVGGLEAYAVRNLFSANAMVHTGWSIPDTLIALGHGMHGIDQPPWHCNAFLPALGLKSSLSDLMIFIQSISNDPTIKAPLLNKAFKKEMKALHNAGDFKVLDGWFVVDFDSYLAYYHAGRTGGHYVSLAFSPQTRKGVVVIANGSAGTSNLGLLILDMVMRAKN